MTTSVINRSVGDNHAYFAQVKNLPPSLTVIVLDTPCNQVGCHSQPEVADWLSLDPVWCTGPRSLLPLRQTPAVRKNSRVPSASHLRTFVALEERHPQTSAKKGNAGVMLTHKRWDELLRPEPAIALFCQCSRAKKNVRHGVTVSMSTL